MFSVIIPVFNNENTIESAIARVNDIPVEKEIIVVNDSSSDKTPVILSNLSLNYLKVIHHATNRGKEAVVHTGIANASGEYLAIQDAELKCDPACYPRLLEALNNQGADIVLGVSSRKFVFGGSLCVLLLNLLFGTGLKGWFSHCWVARKESLLRLSCDFRGDNVFPVLKKALKGKLRIIEVTI
jgi:glycosyltransferase involved in cell wall biosynthesis